MRMICRNFLRSGCNNQDCRWYHFKLPMVRVAFLVFCRLLKLCRVKMSPLSNKNHQSSGAEWTVNLLHPRLVNLWSPPHRQPMGPVPALVDLSALLGTMDIVPRASIVDCSTSTG